MGVGKILESCYYRMPVAVQNLAVTWMGRRLLRKRYGAEHDRELAVLSETWQWSRADLERHREERFRELLAFACDHVPFYRRWADEHCPDRRDLPGLAGIAALPVIDKTMLRDDPGSFLADPQRVASGLIRLGTSGTSGMPLKITASVAARRRHYAFWTRLRGWHGVEPGALRATFFGRIIMAADTNRPPFWRHDRAQNNLLFSSYHLAERHLPTYYEALARYRPAEVIGYPSSLSALARYVAGSGREPLAPRVVFTTAETLTARQRADIEAGFRAPLIDQYGSTEMVQFVAQCGHGSYHVHGEHGHLEVLDSDGAPVAPGQVGEAVCTGFLNEAMPLIRYRLGDRLRPAAADCPCGLPYPVLASIEGRVDDVLLTPDGRPLTRLDPVFKALGGIVETQIVQTAADKLVLRLVPGAGYGEDTEAELLREVRKRTGEGMRIEIEKVAAIAKDANGKFRSVISRI